MTPFDLLAWRQHQGWSRLRAYTELDVSKNRYRRMEEGKVRIPRHIALACSAITMGMPPYVGVRKWAGG